MSRPSFGYMDLPSPAQPFGLGSPSPVMREKVSSAARRVRVIHLSAGIPILALLVPLVLAGCGKKGPPEPPPGEPATYPRPYPSE